SARCRRPRLRSMKNSGSCSCCDTDHVFDFLRRNTEVVGNVSDTVAGHEPVNEILDTRTTMHDKWNPERNPRVDYNAGPAIRRQANTGGPAIIAVRDPSQVVAHDLRELVLTRPDHNKLQEIVFVP